MKWIALLGLLALTPVLAALLRSNPRYLNHAGFVLGLLPFLIGKFNLGAAPITWPAWQGIAKGIEVTVIDALAVAILVAASGKARTPGLLKAAVGIYVLGLLVSTAVSPLKMASSFYVWQFAKSVLLFLAVARATATSQDFPVALLSGGILGLIINGIAAALDHLGGTMQSGGWFGHQNLLGMATHFVIYPAFALLLLGRYQKRALGALLAALLIAYAGGSRATIGLVGIGLVITVFVSMRYRMSSRKTTFAVAALVGFAIASPLAYSAIERRPDEVRASSNEERERMQEAASMLIAEHPLGVGANRYVVVANLEGYSARAGVAWNAANRGAPVHNTYYLVTGELGWLGLLGWLSMLAAMLWTCWSTMRRATDPIAGEIAAGATVTFLMVVIHMYFEWITMVMHIHYLAAITLGLVVGLRSRAVQPSRVITPSRTIAPMARTEPAHF